MHENVKLKPSNCFQTEDKTHGIFPKVKGKKKKALTSS